MLFLTLPYMFETADCKVSFKFEALVATRLGEIGLVWIADVAVVLI
jgi:hypothetical protein